MLFFLGGVKNGTVLEKKKQKLGRSCQIKRGSKKKNGDGPEKGNAGPSPKSK